MQNRRMDKTIPAPQIFKHFQRYVRMNLEMFINALFLSLVSTLTFGNQRILFFLMTFFFLFAIELLICETAIVKNRFFLLHRNYRITFYSVLLFQCTLNTLVGFSMGHLSVTVFLGVAMVAILFGKRAGHAAAIFIAFHAGILFPSSAPYILFLLLTGVATASVVQDINRRIDLALYSFLLGAVKGAFFLLLMYAGLERFLLMDLLVVSILPPISSVLVVGILPYVEWGSRIYSNIGLMELGNLNQPLLKSLLENAPGTYYHSFMLANLSEAAAEKIGVNPILARTGAYFHDIGKIKKPLFFVENQTDENPHDLLAPNLSHLVLQEHIRYGVELCEKYRLPLLFQDLAAQHHGTRVQKFFYNKAKAADLSVTEEQYRYLGPRPKFKEAGILMLADSVEAAARSIQNPSIQKIKEVVNDIINGIYLERQLDDSGLTLKDIEIIIEEFIRVLHKFSHKRIEYPKEEIELMIGKKGGKENG